MSAKFEWTGLQEQYADLKTLATDLSGEADYRAMEIATATADKIAMDYPVRTGTLRNRTHAEPPRTRNAMTVAKAVVVAKAPHSLIYERGTRKRSYNGASRGRMPRGNVFIPQMIQARRRFMREVKQMLPTWGLEARGDA